LAGLLSLDYTGLVPVLIKAMQEQQTQKAAEIADLRAENTALDTEVGTMRAELAARQEQVARVLKRDEQPQPK